MTIIEIVDAGNDQRQTRTRTKCGLALACTSNGSYDTSISSVVAVVQDRLACGGHY